MCHSTDAPLNELRMERIFNSDKVLFSKLLSDCIKKIFQMKILFMGGKPKFI